MKLPSPTARVSFRHFCEEDADELFEILGDPEVMRFSLQGPAPREKVPVWLSRWALPSDEERPVQYAAIERTTDRLLGFCGLLPFDDPDGVAEYEIGYRYRPSCWNQGIGTETAQSVLAFAFEHFNIPTIVAVVERENTGSIRVLEKVGMRYVRESLYHAIPVMRYQLSREEFRR
jgi:ribosomal-protein-alanine N-acetyltransferase